VVCLVAGLLLGGCAGAPPLPRFPPHAVDGGGWLSVGLGSGVGVVHAPEGGARAADLSDNEAPLLTLLPAFQYDIWPSFGVIGAPVLDVVFSDSTGLALGGQVLLHYSANGWMLRGGGTLQAYLAGVSREAAGGSVVVRDSGAFGGGWLLGAGYEFWVAPENALGIVTAFEMRFLPEGGAVGPEDMDMALRFLLEWRLRLFETD
jgi:hypothetical protein